MVKVIHDLYLFNSHVHLPRAIFRRMDVLCPLPSLQRPSAITSVKNRTTSGPDRVRPEHLKNLSPMLINTLARLFTCYLSERKVPSQWKTSRTVLLYKKGDMHGNCGPICLLSVVYKLSTRFIVNRVSSTMDEEQSCEQAGFRRGFSTIYHIHTLTSIAS